MRSRALSLLRDRALVPDDASRPRTLLRRVFVALAAALLATTGLVAVWSSPAAAHGTISDPPTRNYGCWLRWGGDFQNPAMAQEDPMCWQAWQADVHAMWNWNGLFREGVAGDHQAAVPDGTLCSGGLTEGGRYAAMDEPGPWKTVDKPARFTMNLLDGSSHGADYIRVYVTKQGFDPKTQRLKWSDLELVTETGKMPTGTTTPIEVYAPGRTGHHIVYTVWQASHLDQSYYFCSDVNFVGGDNGPGTSPGPSPSVSPSPRVSPSPSPSGGTGTGPGTGGCSAAYRLVSQWNGGFQAEVQVTAGSAPITGWTVTWNAADAQVTSAWNATVSTSGGTVIARNAPYNGSLAAGAGTTFGFIGSGTSGNPTLSCTAA